MRTLAPASAPARFLSIPIFVVGFVAPLACGDAPPRFTEPMVLGGQEIAPQVLERGARAYGLYCVSCHGVDGSGRGSASRSFDTPPRDFREAAFKYVSGPSGSLPSDAELEETILHGRPDTGMPAWNGLDPKDVHALIQYLKTFSPRWKEAQPS